MNKQEIYEFFDAAGIWYEVTEHKAVYNMEEASMLEMPYPEADAKNLFVREDKSAATISSRSGAAAGWTLRLFDGRTAHAH